MSSIFLTSLFQTKLLSQSQESKLIPALPRLSSKPARQSWLISLISDLAFPSPATLLRGLTAPRMQNIGYQQQQAISLHGRLHQQQQMLQEQLQREHLMNYARPISYERLGGSNMPHTTAPLGFDFDSMNAFPRRNASGLPHEFSDFSEASTASELDDSTQNPDSIRSARSAPGALSGGLQMRSITSNTDNELSDLFTSPLLGCHIENPNDRDSSADEHQSLPY